jgi:hypothetical protein
MSLTHGGVVNRRALGRLAGPIALLAMTQAGPARHIEAIEAAVVIGLAIILGIFAVGSP